MFGIFLYFWRTEIKMKKLLYLTLIVCTILVSAQTFIPAYASRVNLVSQSNINSGLQDYVSFGIKNTGSANNTNALNWLKGKYASFGYTTAQVVEDSFSFNTTNSKNLVVTKTGTLYPNIFVLVTAHFDTINGVGANDNGSGTNAILEIARILKDVPTEYSIKFIHFSGEEQGLYGSQHFVNSVVNATVPKMNIRLVFNLDQVGAMAGQTHNTIICEQDMSNNPSTNNAASAVVTQELKNCVLLYSTLQTNTTVAPAYSSDYVPFQNNNEIITGFYEGNGSSNPYPHTANDIIPNMDPVYLFNVTKAALGAVQHFAVASSILSVAENGNGDQASNWTVYPNPAKDFIEIKTKDSHGKEVSFEMVDLSGKSVLRTQNLTKINVSGLPTGVYMGKLNTEGQSSSKKIMITR